MHSWHLRSQGRATNKFPRRTGAMPVTLGFFTNRDQIPLRRTANTNQHGRASKANSCVDARPHRRTESPLIRYVDPEQQFLGEDMPSASAANTVSRNEQHQAKRRWLFAANCNREI